MNKNTEPAAYTPDTEPCPCCGKVHIKLGDDDLAAFIESLSKPPEPNENLRLLLAGSWRDIFRKGQTKS